MVFQPFFYFEEWNDWTSCTADCGSGWKSRSRTCSTGREADCVMITSVYTADYAVCNTDICTTSTTSAALSMLEANLGVLNYNIGNDGEVKIRLEGVQNQFAHFQFK